MSWSDVGGSGGFRGKADGRRNQLLPRVAATQHPTLIVRGERDLILPAAHLEAARTALPRANRLYRDARPGLPSDLFPGLIRDRSPSFCV